MGDIILGYKNLRWVIGWVLSKLCLFACEEKIVEKSNYKWKGNLFWSNFWGQHSHESCFLRCQGQERENGTNALLRKSRKLHIIIIVVAQDIPWGWRGGGAIVCNKTKSILSFLPCLDLKLHRHIFLTLQWIYCGEFW